MNKQPINGITTLFYRNRHLLSLSILVILVAGISAVENVARLEDPRIVNRYPMIITPVPGASAQRVESLVTEVLEESLQEISTIKDIESTSRAGVSIILLELEASVDSSTNQQIFSEIRDKVNDVRHLLPPDAQEPVIDDKRDPAAFTQIIALRWTGPTPAQMGILNRLAQDLSDRIHNVEGTEIVRLYGEPQEEITVTVNPVDLIELGLNVGKVAKLIEAADSKAAAGVLRGSKSDILIEVKGELNSLERIAAIPLATRSRHSVIRIGDISDIQRRWRTPATEISLIDHSRSVLLAARMNDSRRVDHWAQDVNIIVKEFSDRVGGSVEIDSIFQQERYTTHQLSELVKNLLAGAVVVVAVVFLMMGWRLALIIGIALPLVVSMVLFGLQASGNAIHQMSIYGIIIALGLLIDNAIVVADEVSRNKSDGSRPLEAVDKAVRHLFLPLLASTVTTILAFAPIFLLPGNVGDFVSSIGSSVILALAASFLVAITITAGLAGLFAKPVRTDSAQRFWHDGLRPRGITRLYRWLLQAGLRVPIAAILFACFLPASGFLAARSLGNEFFPPVDRDMFEVQVWMQSDSSVENTRRQAEAIDAEIRTFEDIKRTYWLIGGSFPTVFYNLVMNKDNLPHYAQSIVTANSNQAAKTIIPQLQKRLDQKFPDAQIVVGQFGQGPPVVADVEYRIYGPDLSVLQSLGEQLRLTLQSHPDILHTQATMPRGEPKLWFDADEDQARLANLTMVDLANELNGSLEGIVGGSVVENLETLPVRVRFTDDYRSDLNHIASLPLAQQQGVNWVPLSAIGELKLRPELGGITRMNTERTNIIKGYTRNGALPIAVTHQVFDQFESASIELPDGYRIEFGGALEQDAEAMGGLKTYLPMLVVLTIATLVLVFNSVKLALLLSIVAGLSVGPGLLATWASNFPFSFNTILGTLGLIGLAFNNSIVVLASIRANPQAKRGDREAVAEQVIATTRHILSTTLTTIGGFLPLLLIVGGDFWPSLAIVLAGGVGGSMILALVFVPAVYVLINQPNPTADQNRNANIELKPRLSKASSLVAASAIIFLTGCAVGPDYTAPAIDMQQRYGSDASKATLTPDDSVGPTADSKWWQALKDPLLTQLIEEAVARNLDIQSTRAEVRAARSMRQAVKSKLYPNIGVGASYRHQRASENGQVDLGTLSAAGLAKLETSLFNSGFDASWEIDIFGGIQRSIEASDADIEIAIETRRDVLLSVIAEVARNYVELRGAQRRLEVAENNTDIQSATLTLVRNKFKAGITAEIDATRAAAQLTTTQARIPPFRAEIASAAHRLAVLTGKQPRALLGTLLSTKPVPNPPNLVPTGLPSELLRRRPDVRRAERYLAVASARIGQATADLYPRFFLLGLSGLESISASDFFAGSSRAWSVGPSIRWPVFQGGRIRANITAAEAQFDSAYARFQQSILVATEDVESTLVRFSEQQNRLEMLTAAERESLRSVELAHVLYDKGLKDFLTVLDSERVLTEVRDRLVQNETAVVLQMIGLYKALGGGWQAYEKIDEVAELHKSDTD